MSDDLPIAKQSPAYCGFGEPAEVAAARAHDVKMTPKQVAAMDVAVKARQQVEADMAQGHSGLVALAKRRHIVDPDKWAQDELARREARQHGANKAPSTPAAKARENVELCEGRKALPAKKESKPQIKLINGAEIVPEPVRWLWGGYLARGKLHVIAGSPGAGKTTIAMSLAATITTGGIWPDGTRCDLGHVAIWSGEDDPKDTLAPRLLASGADMKRIHFIDSYQGEGIIRSFDPATDMDALNTTLSAIKDVRLLIVDSIVSAVSGDSHKNAEVRKGLQPLVDLGANLDCAILGIAHFSKGTAGRSPTERVTGSLAFAALARVVFAAAKREEGANGSSRMLVRMKSNIGLDSGGFGYDLEQAPLPTYPEIVAQMVRWGPFLEGEARELLAEAESDNTDEADDKRESDEWLLDKLKFGPVPSKNIYREGKAQGFSEKTMKNSKRRLRVISQKRGFSEGWTWELPPGEGAPFCSDTSQGAQQSHTQSADPLGPFDKDDFMSVE